MATVVVKTIGTGGDYTTIQAWEDAAPANLVSADQVWRGELLAQEFVSTSGIAIAGSVVDATRRKELVAASGASWRDLIGSTTPLRYGALSGARIRVTGGYQQSISISEASFRLHGIALSGTATGGGTPLSSGAIAVAHQFDSVFIESASAGPLSMYGAGAALSNSIVVMTRTSGSLASLVVLSDGAKTYNTTFVSLSVAVTAAISGSYGSPAVKNCAFFAPSWAGGTFKTGAAATYAGNKSNFSGTLPTGVTSCAFDTGSGSGFESITAGSHNLRLKSTSALIDAGVELAAETGGVDILGTVRPQGSAYDVGAQEFTSAGPAPISGASSGTFTLSGSASGTVAVVGTSSGTIDLSGSAAGSVAVSGTSSGTVNLTGSATGSVVSGTTAQSSGTITMTGSATGTVAVSGQSSATIALSGAGAAQIIVTGSSDGTLTISGSASGVVADPGGATSYGTFDLLGSATGTVAVSGASTGTLSVYGTATGSVSIAGASTGTFTLTGSASGYIGDLSGVSADPCRTLYIRPQNRVMRITCHDHCDC